MLEATLNSGPSRHEKFHCIEDMIDAAWAFCEEHELEIPSAAWTTDSWGEGDDECDATKYCGVSSYAAIVQDDNAELDDQFETFVKTNIAEEDEVELRNEDASSGGLIRMTRKVIQGQQVQAMPAAPEVEGGGFLLEIDFASGTSHRKTFATAKAMARAAYALAGAEGIGMPHPEWYVECEVEVQPDEFMQLESTCYDAMTRSEDSDELSDFVTFVRKHVQAVGDVLELTSDDESEGGVIKMSRGAAAAPA